MKIFNLIFSQSLLNASIFLLLGSLFVYFVFNPLEPNETIGSGVRRLGLSAASVSIVIAFLSGNLSLFFFSLSQIRETKPFLGKIFFLFLLSIAALSPTELIFVSVDEGSLFAFYVIAHRICLIAFVWMVPLIFLANRSKFESIIYSVFKR